MSLKRRRQLGPFPPPERANPDGIVAIGASPAPEILKIAYRNGIFPWPHQGMPLPWFSPDPRFVLLPVEAHLPKSLRKVMRRGTYRVVADTAFRSVMQGCHRAYRPGQSGTWINDEMIDGYTALHHEGFAHSIEAYEGDTLVGGLYGVSFGRVFCGESMFAEAPDASKVAFATLIAQLLVWGFTLIDCQVYTNHLARFNAQEWSRDDYLEALADAVEAPTRQGRWTFDVTPKEAAELLASDGATR